MNKKTTRLSSIALALMMVLMVALTLVPVSAAFAADESATIEIIDTSDDGTVSSNFLLEENATKTDKIRIKVSKAVWKDGKSFSKVLMTLISPVEVAHSKYIDVEMTKSTTEDGVWYYDVPIKDLAAVNFTPGSYAVTELNGLWSVELKRAEGTWADTEPLELGAFWQYSKASNKVFTAAATGHKFTASTGVKYALTGDTTSYLKPGTVVTLTANVDGTAIAAGTVKFYDPIAKTWIDKDFSGLTAAADSTTKYTLPATAAHGTSFTFQALGVDDTERSAGKCELVDLYPNSVATVATKVTVDGKGPVISDDTIITKSDLVGKIANGIMFASMNGSSLPTDGYNIETSSVTDDDSGIPTPTTYTAKFTSLYNSNLVIEAAGSKGGINKYPVADYPYSQRRVINLVGVYADLVGQSWKLDIVAKDAVGNETVYNYGTVKVYDNYQMILSTRVEAQNVIEMYVGQTLTKQEILDRNVSVLTNVGLTNASLPDEWHWSVDAADSAYFDYDPVEGTVTAKKAGEGKLYATPHNVFTTDGLPGLATTDYLKVVVTQNPSVNTIKLNNSTMTLKAGASQKLTATVDPAGVPITWETGDKSIATVDAEGNVTGVAAGTAVIYAKAGAQVAICTVTVQGDVVATGISLNKTANTMVVGTSETLFATTTPAGAPVSWNTSNAAVATVDNAGKVTAMTAGTATITATSGSYSATCVVTVTGTPETLEPNQWYQDDAGNIYYSNEHSQLTVGWKKIGGYWYLFDYSTAVMKKGWAKDAGTWYYLQSDGKMKTGWLKDGSTWYYLQASGAMKTGWLKDGGVWYYLKDSGAMATGWVKVSGIWYYLQGSGAMKEGWLLESGVWYYLTPSSGAMLANGTYTVEGRKSQFAASGRWLGYV